MLTYSVKAIEFVSGIERRCSLWMSGLSLRYFERLKSSGKRRNPYQRKFGNRRHPFIGGRSLA